VNELALFAGAGGGILGGHLLGWRTVCAVEWEQYPASVLCARQNDKILPPFPIWDDVQTFDGKPWRGIVDVISGGFPCQDISAAGKGAGIEGNKSSMWKHMARIIGEVRPQYVFVENSPMLTSRGLGVVLADLSTLGFDAKWGVVSAADVGANHLRERIWIRAEQRNIFSHTEHNGSGWRQQQSKSIKKTIGLADSDNNGHDNEEQRKLFKSTKSSSAREKFNEIRGHNLLANTSGKGSQREQRQEQHGGGTGFANQSQNVPNTNVIRTQIPITGRKPSQSMFGSSSEKGRIEFAKKSNNVAHTMQSGLQGGGEVWQTDNEIGQNAELWRTAAKRSWWTAEPNVGRVANGVAARVDRLKAIGNGQVPLCAATAWELLK
jgi:DNA (cytosine-5)-methyltransferase 1